jgi:nucleotide-binding universal stress UspA family protein
MKILAGYDRSNIAKKVLKLAEKHAETEASKIEVVYCMAQDRKLKYEDIKEVEQNLESEVHDLLNSAKTPYQTHVLISIQKCGEELVQFAEDNKIDEIIIGVQKKSKAGKIVFGSTAQYVILNATCPVVSIS